MRFSIITPNYNGETFLEKTILSILEQRGQGVDLEYIVIDGGSTDGSIEILEKYKNEIDVLIVAEDDGPADAINKGFALATGDIFAWLNADDIYFPNALNRVAECFQSSSSPVFVFGKCPIVDIQQKEIRSGITKFKELFFPFSCRFTFQCINYISQPAMFFLKDAYQNAGCLRTDMIAAWDYEFILRLWHQGKGKCLQGAPLAAFRWHEESISGQNFNVQFQEEFEYAVKDAGKFSLQAMIHYCVRVGIVTIYSAMSWARAQKAKK